MNILTGSLPNSSNYKTSNRTKNNIKYIVIHYTGNNGDTAIGNVNYFKNNIVKASAHFFVDKNSIYTSVPVKDIAWHCGTSGTYYHKECRNSNSIGIEMCSVIVNGKYTFKSETVNNAINLTKYLMNQYNIPISNVVRHYDVTHKNCPEPYVKDINEWNKFKNRLMEDDPMTDAERNQMRNIEVKLDNLINTINNKMIYNWVDENMPEWARESISRLCQQGYLKGDEEGALHLDDNMLRMLVIMDRIVNK